jgi:transcriptional regulator with XRE-family HTH domain
MSYTTEYIAETLKAAREAKGLSQRDLSNRAGVPQSHISKIESGVVDLRLSSLISLARVLDLELALVPRKTMPAVRSIVRSSAQERAAADPRAYSVIKEIRNVAELVINSSGEPLGEKEADVLRHNLFLLPQVGLSSAQLTSLKSAMQAMKLYLDHPENKGLIREAADTIRELRNQLVHAREPQADFVRPAYSLDEEDGDG